MYHVLSFSVEPSLLEVHFNESLMENEVATFTCIADGHPLPNIVWLHNGSFITTSDTTRQRVSLTRLFPSPGRDYLYAYNSTLQVYNLQLRDAGQYRCRVEPAGVVLGVLILSSSLDLTVIPGERNQIEN